MHHIISAAFLKGLAVLGGAVILTSVTIIVNWMAHQCRNCGRGDGEGLSSFLS